jgi:hypothetical protein
MLLIFLLPQISAARTTLVSQFAGISMKGASAHSLHHQKLTYGIVAGESSLNGDAWAEIDRKTDNGDFKDSWGPASFAVSKSAECRFIRLTQTGKRHWWYDQLCIRAFEFFGTLLE